MNEMTTIGKRCVPHDGSTENFLPMNMKFMQDLTNFKQTFTRAAEFEDPCLLFFKDINCSELRSYSDTMHLFLCLHQYCDWFGKSLVDTLKDLVNKSIEDSRARVLVWTLYVMVLSLLEDWRRLDEVIRNQASQNDPKIISKDNKELFSFCKVIYGYSSGRLYTHAPFYRERLDAPLVDKRKRGLDQALTNLEQLDKLESCSGAVNYFTVHTLLVKSEATWLLGKRDVKIIQEAASICDKAGNVIRQAAIIAPM